jgi:hypothetical protein
MSVTLATSILTNAAARVETLTGRPAYLIEEGLVYLAPSLYIAESMSGTGWDAVCSSSGDVDMLATGADLDAAISAAMDAVRYIVHAKGHTFAAVTIHDATILFMRVSKGDPKCTFMPYIVNADGSPLSESDSDASWNIMDDMTDAAHRRLKPITIP